MRRYVLLIFLQLMFCIPAFAQENQPVYFRAGRVIANPDSAEYYRVLDSQNGDSFSFTEYHKDGTRIEAIAEGSVSDPVYVGAVIFYYKSGKIAIKKEYNADGQLLQSTGYYPNGVLMYITYNWRATQLELLGYDADSSGNVHVINGNGARLETGTLMAVGEHFTMKGPYKDGVKEGIWTGSDDKGLVFEQSYHIGKMISGKATSAGKKYHYTKLFELPRFRNDFDQFNRSILSNLKNLADTVNLEFVKPGYLRLSYVISDHGEVTELKAFRKNEQTIVQLELKSDLPRCTPAKLRGVPVSFVVKDNKITRFRFLPFNTDLYLNGHITTRNHKFL